MRTSKRLPDHEKSQEKNTSLFSKRNSRETNIDAVMEEEAPLATQTDPSSQEGSPEDDDFIEKTLDKESPKISQIVEKNTSLDDLKEESEDSQLDSNEDEYVASKRKRSRGS